MDPSTHSAMDDSTQPLPPPSNQPTAISLNTSPFASAFSASSPSFSSLSSSSSASQSAPSSFSSTFPADTTSTFTQSSPSFTPFSFPAVIHPTTTSTTDPTTPARHIPRTFRPTSTSTTTSRSPRQPLLHAGTKRGSLSRDNDDDDDAIEDDMPARPLKRLHEDYGSVLGEDDEDEDGVVEFEEDDYKAGEEAEDADAGEDTFSNLLTHFAALHVPTSSTKPEQCPICNNMFPLSDFADHVYSCLKVLDDVEKKEQERLDEKMARQLMAREVRLLDESERSTSYSRDRRAMGSDCADGAQCQRTDAQHFQLRSHPEVACPVCGATLPLFDINAHVTACLQDEAGGEGKQVEGREPGGMEDEMSEQQESRAKAAIDTSSSAFSAFRVDKQRRDMADDDSHLPIARDSDDDDDDRKRSPSPPLDPATLTRSASASPAPTAAAAGGGSSDLRLTVEQASAVASMIKEKKQKGGDESVAAMLETFRQLGFTQENLTKLKEAQEGRTKTDEMDRKG